jgi:hypothetical protein
MIHFDATGIDANSPVFSPAPEGDYVLVIKDVKEKKTTTNRDMVGCKCEVAEGPYTGKTVWHNITFIPKGEPGAGMAVHFLKSIGEPFEGVLDADPIQWIGKEFAARLTVEKDYQGTMRNKVKWVKPVVAALPDEEVPF